MSDVLSAYYAKKKGTKNYAEAEDNGYTLKTKRSVHSSQLLTRLAELRDDYRLCDVVLVVKESSGLLIVE
ncbi:hypothetical protein COOONC_04159 [Cooperia oncophora]